MKAVVMSLLLIVALLSGCKATPSERPTASFVMDIYTTDQGFFVITQRGSDDAIAIKFNAEILSTDEPIEIK